MNKILYKILLAALLPAMLFGCRDNGDNSEEPDKPDVGQETPDAYSYEVLKEYTFEDLKGIESGFMKEFSVLSAIVNFIGKSAKYEGRVQMRAYKVMLATGHPDGSGKKINLSGILLAPPNVNGRTYRRVVAPPYTYVMREEAPTACVVSGQLDPNIIFWLLEAYEHGYAVIMPDYPGFGDSYGQCFIPYVEMKPMVRTTTAFIEAAQSALEAEKYALKDGYIIAGYSLGAYVSLQLARELETSDAYATREDAKVDLLMVGGSPCNLLETANLVRAAETLPQPYLLPLVLLGYKNNGYKQLVTADYLREPYASGAAVNLDGRHSDYANFFPSKTSDLFTASFLNNEKSGEINRILDENSVKPWANRCRFIMTHGKADETVYYAQAKNFSAAQSQAGGNVSFVATEGTHVSAGTWFYLRMYLELRK